MRGALFSKATAAAGWRIRDPVFYVSRTVANRGRPGQLSELGTAIHGAPVLERSRSEIEISGQLFFRVIFIFQNFHVCIGPLLVNQIFFVLLYREVLLLPGMLRYQPAPNTRADKRDPSRGIRTKTAHELDGRTPEVVAGCGSYYAATPLPPCRLLSIIWRTSSKQ